MSYQRRKLEFFNSFRHSYRLAKKLQAQAARVMDLSAQILAEAAVLHRCEIKIKIVRSTT